MLSERSQSEKTILLHDTIYRKYVSRTGKSVETGSTIVVSKGCGKKEWGRSTNGQRVSEVMQMF